MRREGMDTAGEGGPAPDRLPLPLLVGGEGEMVESRVPPAGGFGAPEGLAEGSDEERSAREREDSGPGAGGVAPGRGQPWTPVSRPAVSG